MNEFDFFKAIGQWNRNTFVTPILARSLGKCGVVLTLLGQIQIDNVKNIELGNHVTIYGGCHFFSKDAKIMVGDNVLFGPSVQVIASTKSIDNDNEMDSKDIVIEGDNVIGANAVILKGVHLGKGAVVGAGSVVTKDVPVFAVVAGNPARVIRYRYSTGKTN